MENAKTVFDTFSSNHQGSVNVLSADTRDSKLPRTVESILDRAFEFHQSGRLQEAEQEYRALLKIDPQHVDALHLLGLIHHQNRRYPEAITHIQAAIAIKSAPCPILLTNLGASLQQSQRLDEAQQCYRQSIQYQSDYLPAHQNLCQLLTRLGQAKTAADAWLHFGNVLLNQGKPEEAFVHFRFARELSSDQADVHHDLATAVARMGKLQDAIPSYKTSIALDGRNAMYWNNLGWVLFQLGRTQDAIQHFRKALEFAPDYPEAHMCLSMAQLRSGNYAEGWREYEWRWKSNATQFASRQDQSARWDGQPLNGRTLLVETEQGIGDVLQFVRYIEVLANQGESVVFSSPRALQPLLENCASFGHRLSKGDTVPRYDVRIPLLSLPYVLGTTVDTIPQNVPYLSVPPDRVQHWRQRLQSSAKFRIGIVWQGNSSYQDDGQRSFSLQKFGPLASLPDVELVCLQKDLDKNSQLTQQLERAPFRVTRLEPFDEAGPFLDTAAVMMNLDLVIAPNTAVAHLAGALNAPVWVVLAAHATDWRWIENRDDSPWYPSMKLFRQATPGDWDEVFNRIYAAVAARCRTVDVTG